VWNAPGVDTSSLQTRDPSARVSHDPEFASESETSIAFQILSGCAFAGSLRSISSSASNAE
jgi:hypothetical protein